MNLIFQKAQSSDIEQIYAFNKELIDTYEDTEAIDYDKVMVWVRKKICKYINDYTCALIDKQTVAYYHFYESDGAMEIDDLYVFPKYRNKGIGTAIIRRCCEQSSLPVFLYVFKKNIHAISLYERMGFMITQQVGDTRYIMKKG